MVDDDAYVDEAEANGLVRRIRLGDACDDAVVGDNDEDEEEELVAKAGEAPIRAYRHDSELLICHASTCQ